MQVGGTFCTVVQAQKWARAYLQSSAGFAYPSYDSYVTNSATTLCDGDLLAPTLLNARPTITAYESLVSIRPYLDQVLSSLADRSIFEATDADLRDVASLYEPLTRGLPDVQGTTLSKVLHRKRPDLIPLYDQNILWCYRDSPSAPLDRDPGRSWPNFMFLLCKAIQADLHRPEAIALVDGVRGLARPSIPITPLRAWDIVAWNAGRPEHRPSP